MPNCVEHVIDKSSPIEGLSRDALIGNNVEFVCVVVATDTWSGGKFQVYKSYFGRDIIFGARFERMIAHDHFNDTSFVDRHKLSLLCSERRERRTVHAFNANSGIEVLHNGRGLSFNPMGQFKSEVMDNVQDALLDLHTKSKLSSSPVIKANLRKASANN